MFKTGGGRGLWQRTSVITRFMLWPHYLRSEHAAHSLTQHFTSFTRSVVRQLNSCVILYYHMGFVVKSHIWHIEKTHCSLCAFVPPLKHRWAITKLMCQLWLCSFISGYIQNIYLFNFPIHLCSRTFYQINDSLQTVFCNMTYVTHVIYSIQLYKVLQCMSHIQLLCGTKNKNKTKKTHIYYNLTSYFQ